MVQGKVALIGTLIGSQRERSCVTRRIFASLGPRHGPSSPTSARVCDHAESSRRSRMARPCVWPSTFGTVSALGMIGLSRFNGWPVHSLPTLRRRPYGRLRTARGRCGSLLLHRKGLAPSTPCRSPGALRKPSHNRKWTALFDHVVRQSQQLSWEIETHLFRGLELYNKFEFCRL
jgi:hypothetical protein